MRYAILSDVHSRRHKLDAVLADAQSQGAEQIISLGDVGGDDCLASLLRARAMAVFGNYEVSSWRRLAPVHRHWVQHWPPLLEEDGFLAVHAVPWWPEGLRTIEDFGRWLKRGRRTWRALFPYLNEDEENLWQSLTQLEISGKQILFHGHTHVQSAWCWNPAGHLRQDPAIRLHLEADHRYVIGVGSVGLPEDGYWATYALFDSDAAYVDMRRLCAHDRDQVRQ
jgi:predicted phosphodiesterase